MAKFIPGLILGLLIIPFCVYMYFWLGLAPVATAAQAMPFEKSLARIALNTRVRRQAPKSSPMQPTQDDYMAGARVYREQCAVCHGLPGQAETFIGKGEFPHPPQLFKGHGVTDDPVGETYWKVENGIRLTGMPAFGKTLSQDAMWQVSWVLAKADKLPGPVHAILEQPLTTQ